MRLLTETFNVLGANLGNPGGRGSMLRVFVV
jgi:hypothetical protein